MFRQEILLIQLVALLILCCAVGAGWCSLWQLHRTTILLVEDTLPGLMNPGQAAERESDNWNTMRLMLDPVNAAECTDLVMHVRSNSTDQLWAQYAGRIFDKEDWQNYQKVMEVRKNYEVGCNRFLEMVSAGKIQEASTLVNGELRELYERYQAAVAAVFDYNVSHGIERSRKIVTTLRCVLWAVAALTMVVFAFGLILGTRRALSGLNT